MGGVGDILSGLGESFSNIGRSAGSAVSQLLGGAGHAVFEAGPAVIFLGVAFFVILAWVLRK